MKKNKTSKGNGNHTGFNNSGIIHSICRTMATKCYRMVQSLLITQAYWKTRAGTGKRHSYEILSLNKEL